MASQARGDEPAAQKSGGRRPKSHGAPRRGAGLRDLFIALVVLVAGASLMVVELSASRSLAPMFGNTLYTWSSLIGVLLLAMSVGYYVGGVLADRRPSPSTLNAALGASGVAVLLVVPLLRWTREWLTTFSVRAGPAVATLLVFATAGIALGTITPIAVKLVNRDLGRVGLSAGLVSMISTIGSVGGTFAAGFVLVPAMSLERIFFCVGVGLVVLAAAGVALFRRKDPDGATTAVPLLFVGIVAALLNLGDEELPPGVVFQKQTFYQRIQVSRREGGGDAMVLLMLDTTHEGAQLEHSNKMVFDYTRFYRLYKAFTPDLESALFLGGGAFSMPEALSRDVPGARIAVVEIDPEIFDVGRRFFHLSDYPGLQLHADDARRFLLETDQSFDLIFGDAYNGPRAVPPHLLTAEFFALVARRLTGDGVYMMNLISALQGEQAVVFRSVVRTLQKELPNVAVFAPGTGAYDSARNVILVGSKHPIPKDLSETARKLGDPALDECFAGYVPEHVWAEGEPAGQLLTDGQNSIDYLTAHYLEEEEP